MCLFNIKGYDPVCLTLTGKLQVVSHTITWRTCQVPNAVTKALQCVTLCHACVCVRACAYVPLNYSSIFSLYNSKVGGIIYTREKPPNPSILDSCSQSNFRFTIYLTNRTHVFFVIECSSQLSRHYNKIGFFRQSKSIEKGIETVEKGFLGQRKSKHCPICKGFLGSFT